MMGLTEEEAKRLEPYLEIGEQAAELVLSNLSDKDRELAKWILRTKRHLGELGMVEVAIVTARVLRS
jgi:hypothetical protein